MIKYPDAAPLIVVGWSCYWYAGQDRESTYWDPRFRKVCHPIVRRYVIACGNGPRWSELK